VLHCYAVFAGEAQATGIAGVRVRIMITHKERYIIDEQGERVEVILGVGEYHKMLDDLEELEEIRAFDTAKMSNDEAVAFEEALAEIEQTHK
jgi:hypothetical protein